MEVVASGARPGLGNRCAFPRAKNTEPSRSESSVFVLSGLALQGCDREKGQDIQECVRHETRARGTVYCRREREREKERKKERERERVRTVVAQQFIDQIDVR